MKFPRSFLFLPLSVFCLIVLTAPPALADDWKPVDPAELALKASVVEKDADAEAIFWEVRVEDVAEVEGDLIFQHYIRIKVFTERGRESQSKVDILFGKIFGSNTKIKDIAGRTIKPDGTIVELKKEDVFERTIVRASGVKAKAKSFAMPSVEPGSIIEYRWREVRSNQSANYVRLQFQREIPVQNISYYLKPLPGVAMRYQPFHMPDDTKFVKDKNGYFRMTVNNIPAFREEPRMPPENNVRSWMLVYYTADPQVAPEKYWKEFGKRVHEILKPLMKTNDEVKLATTEAVGDATTPEQKLDRIFAFCRTKIKNASNDASGMTAEERAKAKDNKVPSDTLKRGMGSAADIDLLFAAMATAAGFDARVAFVADRSDIFFNPNFANAYFLEPANIAVRVGEQWRFFNPGFNYVPEGMLRWQEEGQSALITDPKEPVFVETPLSGPEKSVEKRTAKLRLSEDGTLEGDVRIEYTGQFAIEKKAANDDDSPAQREQNLRDEIKAQMSTAELSNIQIENATDPVKPFAYSFHISVPGYAQRTGKRLFLQPAFFQHGIGPLFPTSSRTHNIYFHYPWSEEDVVTIELPAGFALDSPDQPAPFASGNLTRYDVKISVTQDQRTLVYKRNFFFGGGSTGLSALYYDAANYGPLKTYFDTLNKTDNHTITLKQGAATASK
ncbi:MAG: hypothetical protein QOH63_1445 [Acidobacteriota bacterium]|nr:hypothetical protein [Acidobacteriota bacterium]